MLGGELFAPAGRHANDDRHVEQAAGHMEDGRRVVKDLIGGEQAEVDGHDFDNGPHAVHGGADARASKAGLGQGRIDDAHGTELIEHAFADSEAAAVTPDIFADEEDTLIIAHRVAERLAHSFTVGQFPERRSDAFDF